MDARRHSWLDDLLVGCERARPAERCGNRSPSDSPELLHDRQRGQQHRRPDWAGWRRTRERWPTRGIGRGACGRSQADQGANSLRHQYRRRCRPGRRERDVLEGRTPPGGVCRSRHTSARSDDIAFILAHENVLERMRGPSGTTPPFPSDAWPNETFDEKRKSLYLNGEGIEMLCQPAGPHRRRLRGVLPASLTWWSPATFSMPPGFR